MRFTSLTQVSESRSVAASSLLLGFSMAYSTRSQSNNVRGFAAGGKSVRLGAGQNGLKPQAGAFLLMIGPTYGLIPAQDVYFPGLTLSPFTINVPSNADRSEEHTSEL